MTNTALAQNEPDTIIRQGTPAPFSGVIVGATRYRFYSEQARIADELKDKKCPPIIIDAKQDEEWKLEPFSAVGGFTIGFSLGAILIAIVK